ncbi:peptide ABC transporter substrate-binding protein [Cuneatibacter sp. NSJ-177]|uniref:peptide ABC transporter substrate-binding protein n=1 Tax=Cuneatibacter sp. NSJ-177 TaxID=2931401 RepID=UPI001FD0983A|nr:peptide ABC transporter substrate-binding protein [Cuneatibacter sp. NSJ-177]MCJ7837204.1 peptide ABC transporter substrate-binding protein [Cuneatibacter sp. NSJ-177]
MRKVLALGLAAAMAFSMAGCSTPGQETTAAATSAAGGETTAASGETTASGGETTAAGGETTGKKVFRYSTMTDPTTLDSCKANSIGDNELQQLIGEGLIRNNAGTLQPGLAETWEVSDDGLTYTFHLRDAVWPDGVAVSANDFVFAFHRLADPATASPYAWILSGLIKNGTEVTGGEMALTELGISAPDEKTVVIELDHPQSYFLSLIGSCCQFFPQRQDVVEKYGQEYAGSAEKMINYGPFIMTSSADRAFVVEKNENYWDADNIKLDRVELSVIENGDTALSMYETGELDYVLIPSASVPNYEGAPNHSSFVNGNLDWIYINNEAEYVSNKNFRLALSYAIDREDYNILVNNGVYSAWGNIVLPMCDGAEAGTTYGDTVQPEGYPLKADETKAKEYLQAAMSELGISDAGEITIRFNSWDNETVKRVAEVCKEMWETRLGIHVEIDMVTYGEVYTQIYPNHDFQVGYGGWGPDYADPYTYLYLFDSRNTGNYSNYKSKEFDALIDQSIAETDPAARLEILAKAEALLIEDGANIPLQMRTAHYLLDEDVTGVNFYFVGYNICPIYADCAPTE